MEWLLGSVGAWSPTLATDAPRRIAAGELLDLGHAHAVEVSGDGVLETTGRDSELEGLL
jgi:hypothetical protein